MKIYMSESVYAGLVICLSFCSKQDKETVLKLEQSPKLHSSFLCVSCVVVRNTNLGMNRWGFVLIDKHFLGLKNKRQ